MLGLGKACYFIQNLKNWKSNSTVCTVCKMGEGDHNHERIERSFSHFPIILSKKNFTATAACCHRPSHTFLSKCKLGREEKCGKPTHSISRLTTAHCQSSRTYSLVDFWHIFKWPNFVARWNGAAGIALVTISSPNANWVEKRSAASKLTPSLDWLLHNFKLFTLLYLYLTTLQIFTPWKLPGLGIAGSLQGKSALSMEKGCKNFGETSW